MAGPVVESTAKIISTYGPNIIRSEYWEKFVGAGAKPGWRGRVQAAAGPHKSGADPHIAGRALDIVLRASIPSEKKVADDLVGIFLAIKDSLKFISVVYNGWEWNGAGQKFVRGGDAVNRHVTHIHIEWSAAMMSHSGFENELTTRVKAMAPSETDYEFD